MVLLQDATELYGSRLPKRLHFGPAHVRRIFHRQRTSIVLERCHIVGIEALHLFL